MSKLLNFIICLAIILLFIFLLSLVIFFVANPSIFKNAKNVLTYIFSFVSITSILAYLLRNIRRERKKQGNYTRALIVFFMKEPLFHIFIWIFIFIESILFCYILPIYYVNIEFVPTNLKNKNFFVKEAKIIKNSTPYDLIKLAKGNQKYRSPRFLSWNEKAYVRAYILKNYPDSQYVAWSAFAFIDAFRGVQLPPLPLKTDNPVEIKILRVEPSFSGVRFITSNLDSTPKKALNYSFKVEKNEILTIIVEADSNYKSRKISFISTKDTTLEFTLEQVDGRVKLIGRKESGLEVQNMNIYVNRTRRSERSGEIIKLEPDTYKIYMDKHLGGNYWAEIDTFQIRVIPNTCKEYTKIVKIIQR